MITLYKIISFLVYLVLWPYGRLKAAKGDPLWLGRLARLPNVTGKDIWLHAASVGEVKIMSFLVDYLLEKNDTLSFHLTVMTRTGFQTAGALFGEKIAISYFPLDVTPLVRRTLDLIHPRLIIVAETEIWPNMILQASQRNIPLLLVNGRMSEKAFGKYRLLKSMFSKLLGCYRKFFFKTDEDWRRYMYFDLDERKTITAGDMKFDAPLLKRSEENIRAVRREIGLEKNDFVFVAGSTRPGEEEILTRVYLNLKNRLNNLVLVLVPRHLERIDEIKALLERGGVAYTMYEGQTLKPRPEKSDPSSALVLVNRMGYLNGLYLASNLAFVGGTLAPLGGHNILEPVWAGTPVIFGPHLDNVREASEYIIGAEYGCKVTTAEELERIIERVYNGEKVFRTKTKTDLDNSPTARIGEYVLEFLGHD
ncbi:MAG: 3-deoxy-D-manno-octulosonic acid transferase [Candidatus Zixiibacteriota bacterium]